MLTAWWTRLPPHNKYALPHIAMSYTLSWQAHRTDNIHLCLWECTSIRCFARSGCELSVFWWQVSIHVTVVCMDEGFKGKFCYFAQSMPQDELDEVAAPTIRPWMKTMMTMMKINERMQCLIIHVNCLSFWVPYSFFFNVSRKTLFLLMHWWVW